MIKYLISASCSFLIWCNRGAFRTQLHKNVCKTNVMHLQLFICWEKVLFIPMLAFSWWDWLRLVLPTQILHYITCYLLDALIQSDLHTQYCGQSPQEQFVVKCLAQGYNDMLTAVGFEPLLPRSEHQRTSPLQPPHILPLYIVTVSDITHIATDVPDNMNIRTSH